MLSRWPIWKKLVLGIALLLVILATLSYTGIRAVYAYRDLVKSISHRARELPLLANLTRTVDQMRMTFSKRQHMGFPLGPDSLVLDMQGFLNDFELYQTKLLEYRTHLALDSPNTRFSDNASERQAVGEILMYADNIKQLLREYWLLDSSELAQIEDNLNWIQELTHRLPQFLQNRMDSLHGEVAGQYRLLLGLAWATSIAALSLLVTWGWLFYQWIFMPLRVLIAASRRVAAGEFHHRVHLNSHDEMAELAGAMNEMTSQFEQIRDDLNNQVKLRTKEVVRSEQLASVGFLAAGVAHEINNPLAAIAMASESMGPRIGRLLDGEIEEEQRPAQTKIVQRYLKCIQDESFRCKEITEKLLDFSRLGDVQRRDADLRQVVEDVISMVRHLGKYREKDIIFECSQSVVCPINLPEMKQVVLNLITNALDSLDASGKVVMQLRKSGENAELIVTDNGCGMAPDVLEHLFEPFFTRRLDGQGTGLGLSITYRIINEHGGRIEPHSDGPGRGSRFRVSLPLSRQAHAKINRKAA